MLNSFAGETVGRGGLLFVDEEEEQPAEVEGRGSSLVLAADVLG